MTNSCATEELLPDIRKQVKANFQMVMNWMAAQDLLEWVLPQCGVVSFPRIKPDVPVDTKKFYDVLLNNYPTYVGPGHWFEIDDRYFRLGFAWEPMEKLAQGIANISNALEANVL